MKRELPAFLSLLALIALLVAFLAAFSEANGAVRDSAIELPRWRLGAAHKIEASLFP